MSKVTCCFECEKRHYNCHSDCKEYNEQKPVYKKRTENVYVDYISYKWDKLKHKKHIDKRRYKNVRSKLL